MVRLTPPKYHNLVKLLESIKIWMINQQNTKIMIVEVDYSIQSLSKLRQQKNESLAEFRKRFVAVTDVLKHIEVQLGRTLVRIVDETLKDNIGVVRTR